VADRSLWNGRRAAAIENDYLRVTVLEGGGHIAEILDKQTGVNPLWVPPWRSIEPSAYDPGKHPEYGGGPAAKLLAGIMGHNLCLDLFGEPSSEEALAGLTVHGEASVVTYDVGEAGGELHMQAHLPLAQIQFQRRLTLVERTVRIQETVESLSATDRPIAWTQHVTLGPPFLERGVTQFRASATRSKVFERDFGDAAYLKAGAVFDWPRAPLATEGYADLRVYNSAPVSSAYTAHLMDPQREESFFLAFHPALRLAFGYVWRRSDFPWMGIWEENHSRTNPPWNGRTLTRGMEFGVSPMPETRREMIGRGRMFDVPVYRWLPARSRIEVEYGVVASSADSVPERLGWPGA
jgi:hypothetical protein